MPYGDRLLSGEKLEGKSHATAGSDEPSRGRIGPRREPSMESRADRTNERVGDDLRWISDPGDRPVAHGKTETEACRSSSAGSRETVSDKIAVRDFRPSEVFHGPPKGPPNPPECRGDLRNPIVVHRRFESPCRTHKSSGLPGAGWSLPLHVN